MDSPSHNPVYSRGSHCEGEIIICHSEGEDIICHSEGEEIICSSTRKDTRLVQVYTSRERDMSWGQLSPVLTDSL